MLKSVNEKLQNSEMIDFLTVERVYCSLKNIISEESLEAWRGFVDDFEYDNALLIMRSWVIN